MLTQNTQLNAENLEKSCLRHHKHAVGGWCWCPNFSVFHLAFYKIRQTLFALLKVMSEKVSVKNSDVALQLN